ncbi:MAG TPA: DUF1573 domain-containing protein [Gemmataceae bacterium]|jgi:hypothetical protein|nr:DUF1573 domain-containing protein [Gemmataceae bacterium]
MPSREAAAKAATILLAAVFGTAAVLKLSDAWINFKDGYDPYSVKNAAGVVELLVSLWLLSGRWAAGALVVTFFVLSSFSVVHMNYFLYGGDACNCFGFLEVRPEISAAVCGLSWLTSGWALWLVDRAGSAQARRGLLLPGLAVGLTGCAVGTWYVNQYPAAEVQDKAFVVVEQEGLDVGSATLGTKKEVHVRVHNTSNRAVRVVGMANSCTCIAASGIPVTIAAYGSAEVDFVITFKGARGAFARDITLLLDSPKQRGVSFAFVGSVVD